MEILKICGLEKSFGEKKVLRGVELAVNEGSIFGFVGKNGAGKTTAMKTVLGLLKADAGEIFVCGERVVYGNSATNRHIGYLPDVPEYYGFMNAVEYLTFYGEISQMNASQIRTRADELLTLVGLSGEKHRIGGFSRGMKQRLGIAAALLTSPRLLICDEPTSALDPVGRREILDILVRVRDNTTVLFSTHILSDMERICTDVALLNDGKISLQGTMEQIKKLNPQKSITVDVIRESDAQVLAERFEGERVNGNTVVLGGDDDHMLTVLRFMADNGIHIERAERGEGDIEQLFLEVMRK